jgi:DNA-binding transcriptional ArsR family regulator
LWDKTPDLGTEPMVTKHRATTTAATDATPTGKRQKEQDRMVQTVTATPGPLVGLKPFPTTQPAVRNAPMVEHTRHGGAGLCAACGDFIINHFDPEKPRVFIGCANPDVTAATVFTMVPIEMEQPLAPHHGHEAPSAGSRAAAGSEKKRKFQVARHFLALPDDKSVKDVAKPGTAKEKVVKALQKAADSGALAREIKERTGLEHGAVQQALQWLRDHGYVESREDRTTTNVP